jgi:hypothetical protein
MRIGKANQRVEGCYGLSKSGLCAGGYFRVGEIDRRLGAFTGMGKLTSLLVVSATVPQM